jgi:quercetin dioxygenase-like cupin family protein
MNPTAPDSLADDAATVEGQNMQAVVEQGPAVLTAEAIAAIPATPLGNLDGVVHRVLWRNQKSMAGVLTVEPGRRLGAHTHRVNHHHLWLLDGRATILGTELGPGSYVHVPSGVEHDIDASATDGCTVFYLYLRYGR